MSRSRLAGCVVLLFALLGSEGPAFGEPRFQSGLLLQVVADGDTCMYFVSEGKEYLLDNWREARAGDCVTVLGETGSGCNPSCGARDGCMHVLSVVEWGGCSLEACGRLTAGVAECVYFESPGLGLYLLSDYGGHAVGDSLRVTGTTQWCLTNCAETQRCVAVESLVPCGVTPAQRTTWGSIRALYR